MMDDVDVVSLDSASESEREQAAAFRLAHATTRLDRPVSLPVVATSGSSTSLHKAFIRDQVEGVEAGPARKQMINGTSQYESPRSVADSPAGLSDLVKHRSTPSIRLGTERNELSSYDEGFLALCVRAYLRHFQPVFPMLHVTSIESSRGSLLYYGIAAVGSHFNSSMTMLSEGERLFEHVWAEVTAQLEQDTGVFHDVKPMVCKQLF